MSQAIQQQVLEGYQETEVGVIPEEWEVKTIGSLLSAFRNGYAFSASGYVNSGIPIITMAQIGINGNFQYDAAKIRRWSSDFFYQLEDFWVVDGDLIIAMTDVTPNKNLIGQMAIVELKETAFLNQRVGLLSLKREIALSEFYSYLSTMPVWKNYCKGVASLGVQANISTADIKKALVVVPSYREQMAIANALSDVDALITSLEKLVAKKRAIKTAAMQQLLTGKKRLPPFDKTHTGYKHTELGEIPEDWEVKPLIGLLKDSPRYGIGAAAVPLSGTLPVYLRITDISGDGYLTSAKRMGVDRSDADDYVLQPGDLVFARTGASVGKSYMYRKDDGKLVYAGFLIKVSPNPEKLVPGFLFHYVSTEHYWSWIQVMSMRSGQPGINGAEYGQMLLPVPSAEEQLGIAINLSDMDADVKAIECRLNKTQQLKQGMMQELLTGRTRLV